MTNDLSKAWVEAEIVWELEILLIEDLECTSDGGEVDLDVEE